MFISKQFFHATKSKSFEKEFTAVVSVPSKESLRVDVWQLLGDTVKYVEYEIGISLVNPKDQYSRKIGRSVSVSKMEKMKLTLLDVTMHHNKKVVALGNERVYIVLEIRDNRKKVNLVEVGISSK